MRQESVGHSRCLTQLSPVARLAREADKAAEKRHRDQQDDSWVLEDEAEDGTNSRGDTTSCSTSIIR
jgi:hypothetical protein